MTQIKNKNYSCAVRFLCLIALSTLILSCSPVDIKTKKIDREELAGRHKIILTKTDPDSPAQVGNGEFAFGVDITGLQTFVPFNTLSHWGWHSDPIPPGVKPEDFKGKAIMTHGRPVRYPIANEEQPELSEWLMGNPHRINLGRLSFILKKKDGNPVKEEDLENARQELDLWTGIITSYFEIEGIPVYVATSCHPDADIIGIRVDSELIHSGKLTVRLEFPYASSGNSSQGNYIGIWDQPASHHTLINKDNDQVNFTRVLDDDQYHAALNWDSKGLFQNDPDNPHGFTLVPGESPFLFTCTYSQEKIGEALPDALECMEASKSAWPEFWNSGAAIDLSGSTDPRWKELERRIVLSQYLMKVNEAGTWPPQESGLVNNGWYGRFHFEMIWWHGVHHALWGRWPLFEKSLHVFSDFLPLAKDRAAAQGYTGARWPKCTANNGVEWPHPIHAMLIWQQPHPIYFAELEYRLFPTQETLEKWSEIVFETAEFMADYAFYEDIKDRYILGPPVYIMSENTNPAKTINPCFELAYWRYGLNKAQEWRERMSLEREKKWDRVLDKLSPLPEEEGVYVTYENIDSMWVNYTFEHPGLTGVYGMLPGNGVDPNIFEKTFQKVMSEWDFSRVWGWDFPMMAMAATRLNKPDLAIDLLLSDSKAFQFDEHGLSTGGPFPYFPSNGGLLSTIAMMAGGWDGAPAVQAPGFPKNDQWVVHAEGFFRMP